ncbi:MAG: ribonuclease R [Sulfurospirillum sp.]|nr:MAG: ribonuclease R [Sulfurospirillum sp.]
MKKFLEDISKGIKLSSIPLEYEDIYKRLFEQNAIKVKTGIAKLDSKYKIGVLDVTRKGVGYLDALGEESSKDLMIEDYNLGTAHKGDVVLVKRLFSRRGASAKVVDVLIREKKTSIGFVDKSQDEIQIKQIKTELPIRVNDPKNILLNYSDKDVLKIDNDSLSILEKLGNLKDPKVDEKISLALFEKSEFFSKEAQEEALAYGDKIDNSLIKKRKDLRDLAFCTIDPPDAKDFDDAIYFDLDEYSLYVAIADVSNYVIEDTYLDKEAKARGFSIYFPHKSIPMLPRSLSENICSLKPNVDRLVFVIKITLDKDTLKPLNEEIFEAVIHSKRRFTYDEVDAFLEGDMGSKKDGDEEILKFLLPLQKILLKIRKRRLAKGCEFRSTDVRMVLDKDQNLIAVKQEFETPAHSLIEDAMLLANKAASKQYEKGIFRVHDSPDPGKIEKLLNELETIGLESPFYEDPYETIKELQKLAQKRGLRDEIDSMIIRTQKQAQYSSIPKEGHFGLGFKLYTHFTSPIRRYSDLLVHRILKAILKDDRQKLEYFISNAEVIAQRVSELEREASACEWDFRDRKYARWFDKHKDKEFDAMIISVDESMPLALSLGEIYGARIHVVGDKEFELFERVKIKITNSSITTTKIIGTVI